MTRAHLSSAKCTQLQKGKGRTALPAVDRSRRQRSFGDQIDGERVFAHGSSWSHALGCLVCKCFLSGDRTSGQCLSEVEYYISACQLPHPISDLT